MAACAAAVVVGAWLLARHAAQYFFLFDDFPLNGQASRWPLGEILGTPLFGFYRPGFFLWLRGWHGIFGWHAPQGFAAAGLLLHAANAMLVSRVAGRMLAGPARWFAATLFFLSPWSAEAFFWVSGGFDLLATCGALVASVAALSFCGGAPRSASAAARVAVCLTGTLVALFTKESTVILAPLVVALAAASAAAGDEPGPEGLPGTPAASVMSWPRIGAITLTILGVSVAYLAVRRVVAASLTAGAYGDWFALVGNADVAANLGSYARAAVDWPARHDAAMRTVGSMIMLGPLASAGLAAFVLAAIAGRPRAALALVVAAVVAVVPILWLGLHPGTSAAGRVVYLAGVPFVLLCALGLQQVISPGAGGRWVAAAGAAAVLAAALTSLDAQRAVWAQACRVSRASVEAFRPFLGQTAPIHIDNLPFWFAEGPYVMKSYAFAYYFFPAVVPPATGTALELISIDGRVTVTTRQPEPGAGTPPPGARPVTLDIELR